MSATQGENRLYLRSCLLLIFSEQLAQKAVYEFDFYSDEEKIYALGCIILSITASVHPKYTLITDRRSSFRQAFCTESEAADLSEAGLFAHDTGEEVRVLCFHCGARMQGAAGSIRDPWLAHATVSPNCYFCRYRDFIIGNRERLYNTLATDIVRNCKALSKLLHDLSGKCVRIACDFGFNRQLVTFCATRHFMRNGGKLPARAGDLIAQIYNYETLFSSIILQTVDVQRLLQEPKVLHCSSGQDSHLIGRLNRSSGQVSIHRLSQDQYEHIMRHAPHSQ